MKTKGLVFVSCLALIASPAMGKPKKKSSVSQPKRTARHTTQVVPNDRHRQNNRLQSGSTRYYNGGRYSTGRSYAGPQYTGARLYGSTAYYSNNYYRNTGFIMAVELTRTTGTTRACQTRTRDMPRPGDHTRIHIGAGTPTVVTVTTTRTTRRLMDILPRRLQPCSGALANSGYYHGVVDGVIGPQTRGAIAAFKSRNGLVVDGRISRPLINTLGLT
jgi:Putative peptidoglycan binding domain